MAWILLVVALALVAGYLIITFGYRTSVFVLLSVLVLGLVMVIWYAEFHQATRSNLISTEEVELENFNVEVTYGNSFKMFARVRNLSADHALIAVGVEISASDCTAPDQEETCVIVGQQEQEIQVNVPERQARDITRQFIFPPMRPQGELKWSYSILYATAQK
jgi:hypothetical protein